MGRVTKDHNFLRTNPHLQKEWHPIRNGNLKPQDIAPMSTKRIWWICEMGHEWEARAYTRTRGSGCPFCIGKRRDELSLTEWISQNKKIGFGKNFRIIQETAAGKVLVEMPREAWENLALITLSPEDIGTLIREYRRRQELTQKQFAKVLGRHRNYLAMIERGESDRITYNTYQKIMSVILKGGA